LGFDEHTIWSFGDFLEKEEETRLLKGLLTSRRVKKVDKKSSSSPQPQS
jgi:hypothetical protein